MGPHGLPRGRFFGHARLRRDLGDLVLVESHHAAGSRVPRHSHDRAYFCLNFGGTYLESYGRRRRRCCSGMLVFHPPGECHEEDHHSDVSSLNVELDGTWLRRIAELVAPLDRPAEFGGDDIAVAAAEILRELRRDDRDSALAIEGLTFEILAACADRRPTIDKRAPRWLRDARVRQNGSFIVNGSSIQVTQTCPPGSQPFTSYDSDGTKFRIYAPAVGVNPAVMFEYTKQ